MTWPGRERITIPAPASSTMDGNGSAGPARVRIASLPENGQGRPHRPPQLPVHILREHPVPGPADPFTTDHPDRSDIRDPAGPAGPAARPIWLSVSDVAGELGISLSTWNKWRIRGVGPRALRLPNGSLRIRRDWFDDWLRGLSSSARTTADDAWVSALSDRRSTRLGA